MGLKHKLEKIDITKFNPSDLIGKMRETKNFGEYVFKTSYPEYLYWSKIKYKEHPPNMSAEEFWAAIKLLRANPINRRQSFIRDENGETYSWQHLPGSEIFYHNVDKELAGYLSISENIDKKEQLQFISRGIIEEAIASSQLEGAATTRRVAKQMIREKREPRNESEQMILNNYKTMVAIEDDYRNVDLTVAMLLELQMMLTEGTKILEKDIGRFRNDSDNIEVIGKRTNLTYHKPPKEEFVKKEIKRLVDYFNDKLEDKIFVHPLTKAIIIHFWIGYLHPFCDGNGRLARVLFYWYLIKKDYWAFTFLPLSKMIKNSPAQYRDAYIYTEQDDWDLTYFIDYNIRKIKQAKNEFRKYLEKYKRVNQKVGEIAKSDYGLNSRQIMTLNYLYKNTKEASSVSSYSTIYNVSRMTATKDLKQLLEQGFVVSKKVGKYVYYFATDKVAELFDN